MSSTERKLAKALSVLRENSVDCGEPKKLNGAFVTMLSDGALCLEARDSDSGDGEGFTLRKGNNVIFKDVIDEQRAVRAILDVEGVRSGGLLEQSFYDTAKRHSVVLKGVTGDEATSGKLKFFFSESAPLTKLQAIRREIVQKLVIEGYFISHEDIYRDEEGMVCELAFDNSSKVNRAATDLKEMITEDTKSELIDMYLDARASGDDDEQAKGKVAAELGVDRSEVANAVASVFGFGESVETECLEEEEGWWMNPATERGSDPKMSPATPEGRCGNAVVNPGLRHSSDPDRFNFVDEEEPDPNDPAFYGLIPDWPSLKEEFEDVEIDRDKLSDVQKKAVEDIAKSVPEESLRQIFEIGQDKKIDDELKNKIGQLGDDSVNKITDILNKRYQNK